MAQAQAQQSFSLVIQLQVAQNEETKDKETEQARKVERESTVRSGMTGGSESERVLKIMTKGPRQRPKSGLSRSSQTMSYSLLITSHHSQDVPNHIPQGMLGHAEFRLHRIQTYRRSCKRLAILEASCLQGCEQIAFGMVTCYTRQAVASSYIWMEKRMTGDSKLRQKSQLSSRSEICLSLLVMRLGLYAERFAGRRGIGICSERNAPYEWEGHCLIYQLWQNTCINDILREPCMALT